MARGAFSPIRRSSALSSFHFHPHASSTPPLISFFPYLPSDHSLLSLSLQANGAPQQKVELREVIREGRPLDVAVAAADLKSGERALEVPDELVVTLSRVFEDGALAELLTTNKLSELACLALFLMYEKKLGSESKWQPFIKELDRIQARGALGAKSPLLWTEEERARLLRGSPLLAEAEARVAAVEKEYEELDTVWFMAGSLFNR